MVSCRGNGMIPQPKGSKLCRKGGSRWLSRVHLVGWNCREQMAQLHFNKYQNKGVEGTVRHDKTIDPKRIPPFAVSEGISLNKFIRCLCFQ